MTLIVSIEDLQTGTKYLMSDAQATGLFKYDVGSKVTQLAENAMIAFTGSETSILMLRQAMPSEDYFYMDVNSIVNLNKNIKDFYADKNPISDTKTNFILSCEAGTFLSVTKKIGEENVLYAFKSPGYVTSNELSFLSDGSGALSADPYLIDYKFSENLSRDQNIVKMLQDVCVYASKTAEGVGLGCHIKRMTKKEVLKEQIIVEDVSLNS